MPLPNRAVIQRELSRKGVTLLLLWQEYKALHPAGYQYSRFADLYRAWLGTRDAVLRQVHAPGDKLFVDDAGQTGSRKSVFEAYDRPALRPLPVARHEYATWKKAKVHLDYHVDVERHYYPVPHGLIGRTVDLRLCASTVEIFHRGSRVAELLPRL